MNRKSLVMIALGALVAGALVLVYAMSNAPNRREVAFAGAARSTMPAPRGDGGAGARAGPRRGDRACRGGARATPRARGGKVAETAATPAAPPSETSKVLYDFNA